MVLTSRERGYSVRPGLDTVRIESSEYEMIDTCVREKFTKYNSPLGSWHLIVAVKVSLSGVSPE
ncbi:MAG: hypothetical protein WC015_01550 [Methanoregula sp.]|jgi:hypothetical protein